MTSMGQRLTQWSRRTATLALPAALLAAIALPAPVQAKWPEKPVKIILPFGAGGVADVTSRILADRLSKKFGERVIIENMPGPGGIAAAKAIISGAPDGYTMGYVTSGTAISAAIFKKLPFDPTKEIKLITMVAAFDPVFVVNAQSEFKTLQDFIKAAKANPGKMNIGTIAVGGTQNLAAELFKTMADINVAVVPYKNSPDIVVGLLRNDVQMMVDFSPSIKGALADNKVRVLAVGGSERSPIFKDVPTVAEAGVAGYEVEAWNGIGAPLGTPQDVADTMAKAVKEVLADKDVQASFINVGVVPNVASADAMMKRLTTDIKKWNGVIDKAGIVRK
ncbi:MAG: Bug family tripartite tricarboxylate transporter substrate binding protein [Pseudolabrys sp.]